MCVGGGGGKGMGGEDEKRTGMEGGIGERNRVDVRRGIETVNDGTR